MESFESYFLKEHYEKAIAPRDRLSELNRLIDWGRFRVIVQGLYDNKSSKGGRPNIDEVVMIKALLLQSLYNLSDPELEYQINDRISFRNFLGMDQPIPDFTTIWRFRERVAQKNLDHEIWNELQRQLEQKGILVKRGVIQDATFVESPTGRARTQREKKEKKKKGKGGCLYKPKLSNQVDRDSTFAKKNNKLYHGHKLHIKVDLDYGFIRDLAVTTASVHDNQIDLVVDGDRRVIRDKGYFGKKLSSPSVEDYTMKRAVRNHPLSKQDRMRNRILSRLRSPGERPFAIIKNVFERERTRLKRQERVRVQQMFNCFAFNLYHLYHCKRRGRIA